jgi:DNA-binding NtrC family response regulator
VGARADVRRGVRILAATHRSLPELVRMGRFRADLFYRLAVVTLRVPPLRERAEDLPHLAEQLAKEAGVLFSRDLLLPLAAYDWPGNVRELRNLLQSGALVRASPERRDHSPSIAIRDDRDQLLPLQDVRRRAADSVEALAVAAALKEAKGNLTHAAELLGITRQSFTALAQKHGLHPGPLREA